MNEVVKLLQERLERMENGIRWEQEAQVGAITELDARSCAQETTLQHPASAARRLEQASHALEQRLRETGAAVAAAERTLERLMREASQGWGR